MTVADGGGRGRWLVVMGENVYVSACVLDVGEELCLVKVERRKLLFG